MRVSRRQFAVLGAVGAGTLPFWPVVVGATAEDLRSRHLMDLELEVGTPQAIGSQTVTPVTGGTFRGPRLRGVVLDGGGDWMVHRPDGARELNVRTTLQTDDDALIYLWHRGLLVTPERGETYWRTTPVFETATESYAWLNQLIAVGVGRRVSRGAVYRLFEVL